MYAGYVRVSTEQQNVDPQIERIKKWSELSGKEVRIFKDEAVSALDERKAFNRMMNRIDEFEGVVITDLSRLGRSANQLTTWMDELERKGKHLVVLDLNLDTSTKYGRFLFNILSAVAELEREIIYERMQAGREKAKKEKRLGRPKKKLDVSEMAKMYKMGASYRFLAKTFGVSESTVYERLKSEGVISRR